MQAFLPEFANYFRGETVHLAYSGGSDEPNIFPLRMMRDRNMLIHFGNRLNFHLPLFFWGLIWFSY